MNADIFISYSTLDRHHALTLVEQLRAAGHSVWIDQQGIDAATSWSKEIAEALEECSTFMLLLSPHSLTSDNVAKELAVAAELKKHIIPIELESVQLKREFLYHLTGLQRVSHTNIDAIIHALEKYSSAEISPESYKKPVVQAGVQDAGAMKRIAVLPFEDLSPNHDNEWFSDGLTNELISTLTKLPELSVIDKQTSKMYKSAKLSSKQIANELNVRYLVTGEVRKAGERIRIQASLLDTKDGRTLWDEKFNGTMDDIFEIQEKTALDITEGLKLKLTPEEERSLESKLTDSVEAYELYLRAEHLRAIGAQETALEAMETVRKALLFDPNFAELYVIQADLHMFLYKVYGQDPQHYIEAERLINKALEVKPGLPVAKRQLGWLRFRQGKYEESEELLLYCLREDPKDSKNFEALADFYYWREEYQKAIPFAEKAYEYNPDSVRAVHILCQIYQLKIYNANDPLPEELIYWAQKGLPISERLMKNDPHNESLPIQHAFFLIWSGQRDIAKKFIDEMSELTDARSVFNRGILYLHLFDDHAAAKEFLKALEMGFTWFQGLEHPDLDKEVFAEVRATVARKKAELAAKTQKADG
jgi:TolB-like protein